MRLKVFTGFCLAAGFGLLLAWPWILGWRPKGLEEFRVYRETSLAYLAGLLLSFVGSCLGAILIVRQAKTEYRRTAAENMKRLLEGTLEDHRRAHGRRD